MAIVLKIIIERIGIVAYQIFQVALSCSLNGVTHTNLYLSRWIHER